MDCTCTIAHFSVDFGSARVGVKHSSATGSDGIVNSMRMKWSHEMKLSATARLDFICALAHCDVYSESV